MKRFLAGYLLLVCGLAHAGVELPLTSDGMVLQRATVRSRAPGTADAGSRVRVEFDGDTTEAVTDNDGRWRLMFARRMPQAGLTGCASSARAQRANCTTS